MNKIKNEDVVNEYKMANLRVDISDIKTSIGSVKTSVDSMKKSIDNLVELLIDYLGVERKEKLIKNLRIKMKNINNLNKSSSSSSKRSKSY